MKKLYIILIAVAVIAGGILGFNTIKANSKKVKSVSGAFADAQEFLPSEIDIVVKIDEEKYNLQLFNKDNNFLGILALPQNANQLQILYSDAEKLYLDYSAIKSAFTGEKEKAQWVVASNENYSFTVENYKEIYKSLLCKMQSFSESLPYEKQDDGKFTLKLNADGSKDLINTIVSQIKNEKENLNSVYDKTLSVLDSNISAFIKDEVEFDEEFQDLLEVLKEAEEITSDLIYSASDDGSDSFELIFNIKSDDHTYNIDIDLSIANIDLASPEISNKTPSDIVNLFEIHD